ncbi:MAG: tRNA (adenosine(37)-N6)-threonylcarbamoyltransferase complex dimerization subunit type 1 TsaB [Bacteroidales bacterium]
MPTLLHIETSTEICSVALSSEDKIISFRESAKGNEHAALIATYISETLQETGYKFKDIDSIIIGKGPGSYTGLRIGVSTAKGLAYALEKPLIGISPLQAMAKQAATLIKKQIESQNQNILFCPMTDAGRMEVYAGLYDIYGHEIRKVSADIVDTNTYAEYLQNYTIYFAGNGCTKCKPTLSSFPNALFLEDLRPSARYMLPLALEAYKEENFENIAYFEPFYLKDFIAGKARVKGLY